MEPQDLLSADDTADPAQRLRQALLVGNAPEVLAAFRLLVAQGRLPDLDADLEFELAECLAPADPLEAARAYRRSAEKDLAGARAPVALLLAGRLLIHAANLPVPGRQMLIYLIEKFPEHAVAEEARDLLGSPVAATAPVGAASGYSPRVGRSEVAAAGAPAQPSDDAGPRGPRFRPALAGAFQVFSGRLGTRRYWITSRAFAMLFLAALGGWLATFFTPPAFQRVRDIHPSVLAEPDQRPSQAGPVLISRGDDNYRLEPTADYEIAGLVVGARRLSYASEGLSEDVFPLDLCLIWGPNVRSGVFRSDDLEVVQAGRVCYFRWRNNLPVEERAISNNHLIAADDAVARRFSELRPGQQVRLRGQLVDVHLVRGGRPATVRSSRTRDDGGYGACEILYVTHLEILKPAPLSFDDLHRASFWAMVGLLGLFLLRFVLLPATATRSPASE